MSESDDSLPRLLGGRYRLEAKLGAGGMGVVYRATDLTMHRPVAVKLIRGVDGAALDDEVSGRFLREAKNTARIQHENIIEVYDLGHSDDGDMFFVMELLEGESLSAKLRREGKIDPTVTVHIARQMCAALHVAHAAGVIHRDLKPANVMLVHRDNDPNYVKVLDFGVAKSYTLDQQTQLTHTGMLVGTVEYMAPEQIMGRIVDGRTDLYSLGVVMYRMLTGKPPFRDGGVPALIHAHLNLFPKPMSETKAKISGELDRVVLRCLAKQPEKRYESMEELSRALAAAVEPPPALVNLEYDGEDVYDASDSTAVARPSRAAPSRVDVSPPPAARSSVSRPPAARPSPLPREEPASQASPTSDDGFDDIPTKVNRRGPFAPPQRVLPVASPMDESGDRTAVMIRDELSTARRPIPESVTRPDSVVQRECAMCRTMNAPHARACIACGVSLAREEQEAVRARVTAPRAPRQDAPQVVSVSPAAQLPPPPPPPPHGHPSAAAMPPMHATQGPPRMHAPQPRQSYPSVNWQGAAPAQNPQRPGAWHRFLVWTGLR